MIGNLGILGLFSPLLLSTLPVSFAQEASSEDIGATGRTLPMPNDELERGIWLEMDEEERKMRNSKLVVRDPALNAYVRDVLCRTIGAEKCADVRIYILRMPAFNASMAPNGMMQVWTGLLFRLRNEAQLAAVLGHEFAHFEQRHSLKLFKDLRDKSDAAVALSLIPFAGIASLALLGSVFTFSREQEREADTIGLSYMAGVGYDPHEFARIWSSLRAEMDATAAERKSKSRKNENGGFFATHPNSAERMEYLTQAAEQWPAAERLVGTDQYRAGIAGWQLRLVEDQIKSSDFGGTEFLLTEMAKQGWTADLHFARGELFRTRAKDGDLVQAINFYESAIAMDETLAESWRGLGMARLRLGQKEQAKQAFKAYLERKPDASDRAMIELYIG